MVGGIYRVCGFYFVMFFLKYDIVLLLNIVNVFGRRDWCGLRNRCNKRDRVFIILFLMFLIFDELKGIIDKLK